MKFRLFKFLTVLTLTTLIALVYVHQHIELVKLSYAIDSKEKNLEDILDRKENLEYNIEGLEAPSRLEKALLSRNIDITLPRRSQIVKVAQMPSNAKTRSYKTIGLERKTNIFGIFQFFGLRAEAQAKER